MASFLTSHKAFEDPVTCRMEIMNEFVVLIVGYHMVTLMSTTQLDADKRDNIGTSLVTVITILCVVNSLKFCYDQVRHSIRHCKRIKAKIVHK